MVKLRDTWLVEPIFDFEYKTYELKAYSRDLSKCFSEMKYYPYLPELERHMALIETYRTLKAEMEGRFRRELCKIDLKRLEMVRERLPQDSGVIAELDEIIDFAREHLMELYKNGRKSLDDAVEKVQISPLGIVSASTQKGFLLFRKSQTTRIYTYEMRLVRRPGISEKYKDVKSQYLTEISTGMFTNFNEIKWDLLKREKGQAAQNAFLVETNTELPQYETLLPLAKHYILENLE